MELWHIIVLAIIQGLTEFLPISSSAHLILPSELLGWQDQGLAFDVAVHVGTLSAVIWYFRRDVGQLTVAWCQDTQAAGGAGQRLAWAIIVATIPAGLAGILLDDLIEEHLRSAAVIAATTIGFGLVLWWSDAAGRAGAFPAWTAPEGRPHHRPGPGAGADSRHFRSGITITAALFLGFNRDSAARFSFLLSIPLIAAAGMLKTLDLIGQGKRPSGNR